MSGYDEETHKLSFNSYGWEDGLNNDVVMSIIDDDNGFLWLATEKG
ncbi:two-component regulator propeller domain-containing protein, partial [Phocaeicola vulgatus]